MSSVNALAQLQRSTYSKVNLDFVLNINHYSSESESEPVASAESAQQQVTSLVSSQMMAVMQCIPCGGSGNNGGITTATAGSSSAISPSAAAAMTVGGRGGGVDNNLNSAYVPHIRSDITTHGIKIEGLLDKRRLELFLDALLFGGFNASSIPAAATSGHVKDDSGANDNISSAVAKMEVYRMKGILHLATTAAVTTPAVVTFTEAANAADATSVDTTTAALSRHPRGE